MASDVPQLWDGIPLTAIRFFTFFLLYFKAKFTTLLNRFHQVMSLVVIVRGRHGLWPSLSNPREYYWAEVVSETHCAILELMMAESRQPHRPHLLSKSADGSPAFLHTLRQSCTAFSMPISESRASLHHVCAALHDTDTSCIVLSYQPGHKIKYGPGAYLEICKVAGGKSTFHVYIFKSVQILSYNFFHIKN